METENKPLLADIAKDAALREGVGALRQVFTPPADAAFIDVASHAEYLSSLAQSLRDHKCIPEFIDALTKPLTEEEKKSGMYAPPKHEEVLMTGTYDEIQDAFTGQLRSSPFGGPWAEMTDGLPVVPPTEDRVAAMLQGTSHDPDEIMGSMGPRAVEQLATVKKVAINAVMAGCKPEDMPAVLAIAESGACVGYPGDASMGYMYVVSGPYAKEIGMNSGFCLLNPGNPANTRLQRACTLMGINLGGSKPGINNNERMGAVHWGTIFAESEDSPWEGLNERLNYKPDESILLALGGLVHLVPLQNLGVRPIEGLQSGVPLPGGPSLGLTGDPKQAVTALKLAGTMGGLLLFTPDTARFWVKELGFKTIRQLQDYLWERVTWKKGTWMNNYEFVVREKPTIDANPRGSRMLNPDYYDLPDDADVPMFMSPDVIMVLVAGGSGHGWGWGGRGRPRVLSIDKWR